MLPLRTTEWVGRKMGTDRIFMDALDKPERSSYEARAKGTER
jgi:hypothetical protein